MDLDAPDLWKFLPLGYLFSILVETPILLLGLSPRHSYGRRLFAGVWLTACTYPVVGLVLPLCLGDRWTFLLVAETFAPVAECALFWMAFGTRAEWGRRSMWRDFAVITVANLASFGLGELLRYLEWFPPDSWLGPRPEDGSSAGRAAVTRGTALPAARRTGPARRCAAA